MLQKVTVENAGDTLYLHGDRINRFQIQNTNEELKKKAVVTNSGDSDYEEGDVVYSSNMKDANKELKEAFPCREVLKHQGYAQCPGLFLDACNFIDSLNPNRVMNNDLSPHPIKTDGLGE